MKHKLKKILLLYIISGTLFVSCSLEEEYLKQDNANLKIKIERKTFHELMKEEKFNAAYTKISKQKNPISSSALGRTVMEAEYDFTISNIPAKVITYGNNISYNFHINRNVSNSNYFENLVVKVDSTTIPKAYIIKYILNSNPLFISEHNAYTLDAQTEITQINYNDTEAKIEYYDGCAVVTLWCPYDGPHPAGPECLNQRFDDLYWVRDTSGCGDGLDSGGGGSSGPVDTTGGGGSSGPVDTTGGGGGTGGTGDLDTPHNDSGNNNPIVTAPVLELEEENEENNEIDPCISLKETQKTDKANINPILQNYKTNLYHFGENATRINKNNLSPQLPISNNYSYTQNVMPLSLDRSIDVPILSNQTIIIIHTHPYPLTYSMFSWGDAYQYLMLNQLSNIYRNDLTLMLVTYNPVTNTNDVYALKVENMRNFRNKMNNQLNSLGAMDLNLKIETLNEELGEKFVSETNLEKAFLEYFDGYGISLYKAEDNLSNWKKLEKNLDPVSYLVNPVIEKPCNN